MGKLEKLHLIVQFINGHPLAGRHKMRAWFRFLRWQVVSRIGNSRRIVSFTSETSLSVQNGMTGATGNIYTGLHDFEDMGFLLHFLRPEDMFVDVGANVGCYTVLASGHVGSHTIAFEPIPDTCKVLLENVRINNMRERVRVLNKAVGATAGKISITQSLDTINHVVPVEVEEEESLVVDIVTVDDSLEHSPVPALIKIDVEGFETEVIKGMKQTILNTKLKAIIIELNGSGGRYGYLEADIHEQLLHDGFSAYQYDPFERKLKQLETFGAFNTLYLRDMDYIQKRLQTAPKINLLGEHF